MAQYPYPATLIRFALTVLVTLTPLAGLEAWGRVVRKSELQPFAAGFKCSNPLLQWQFDRLITLVDENEKMRAKAKRKHKIVDRAEDVEPGGGDWLYRGVTNHQFSEEQILKLVFNDSTSVSESRWFTQKMFNTRADLKEKDDLVEARSAFQELPQGEQCRLFKSAFQDVSNRIERLARQTGEASQRLDQHVKIGAGFDATPQAIQFLTPHKAFAEMYGEFVLHIRPTVKRGIDVERYNFHHPEWDYQGDIYAHDKDEYMVPSHIPGWDVQAIKVREGTGWHQEKYGPTLYYYSKVHEPKNPCNVIGITVDKPNEDDNDGARTPVGILLRCPGAGRCESEWPESSESDSELGEAAIERLKGIVANVKIDGRPIRYLPYGRYLGSNPAKLKATSLAGLVGHLDGLPASVRGKKEIWQTAVLAGYSGDYLSAAQLYERLPQAAGLKAPDFRSRWTADWKARLQKPGYRLQPSMLGGYLELGRHLKLLKDPVFLAPLQRLFDQAADREDALKNLKELAEQEGGEEFAPLVDRFEAYVAQYEGLTPTGELALIESRAPGRKTEALVQATALALAKDEEFAASYWSTLKGSDAFKASVLEAAIVHLGRDPETADKSVDTLALWKKMAPSLEGSPARESVRGLCINQAIAQGASEPGALTQEIAEVGLPKDREVTTIRALWNSTRNQMNDGEAGNPFEYYSRTLRALLYEPLAERARASDEEDKGGREAYLDNRFAWFYGEYVTAPVKFYSFSALNEMRNVTGRDDLILLPKGQKVIVGKGPDKLTLDSRQITTILKQSFSVYYLQQLRKLVENEEDPALAAEARKTLKAVIPAYIQYGAQQLAVDLAQPVAAKAIKDRNSWNPNEDVTGLLRWLSQLTRDQATVRKLQAQADKVEAKLPAMDGSMPEGFLDDQGEVDPFWTSL